MCQAWGIPQSIKRFFKHCRLEDGGGHGKDHLFQWRELARRQKEGDTMSCNEQCAKQHKAMGKGRVVRGACQTGCGEKSSPIRRYLKRDQKSKGKFHIEEAASAEVLKNSSVDGESKLESEWQEMKLEIGRTTDYVGLYRPLVRTWYFSSKDLKQKSKCIYR